jgi:hypothetical protein
MRKIGIFVPDGIGVRNYLYSNVLKGIEKDCIIVHSFNEQAIEFIKKESGLATDFRLPKYREGIFEKFYRELLHKSRLQWNVRLVNNPTILTNYNPSKRNLKSRIFYFLVGACSNQISSYEKILNFEEKYIRSVKKNVLYGVYKESLQSIDLKILLCTHQRALNAPILFLAAKELGIKTVVVIYSWDNIPKARLALRADEYLVWSDFMKRELIQFYPEIRDNQVLVTGSPQFEFSLDSENIIDQETFYSTYQLNPDKKNICYSANDLTSPNEVLYLQDLIDDLKRHNAFEIYQLLFRLNPADLSGRFDRLLEENKALVKNISPIWRTTSRMDWASNIPTRDDVKLLTSTCYYSDVVINLGSTMVFDFSVFNKPCIYINYNQENLIFDVNTVYQFQHFRSMPTDSSVGWVNSKSDFFNTIEEVLNSNKADAKKWFNVVVNHFDSASDNIQNVLKVK